MWHETNTQKDHTILRQTCFPNSPEGINDSLSLILSGPHFFVSNPLNKTPRNICTLSSHYDVIDLTQIPDDYLPRTNYVPDCDSAEYRRSTPKVSWGDNQPVTDFYRVVNREMIGSSAERTFIPALIPKGVGHVHTCIATVFQNQLNTIDYLAMGISLPIDFFVKTTGMGHANQNILRILPLIPTDFSLKSQLRLRTLTLNCLTTHYAKLWQDGNPNSPFGYAQGKLTPNGANQIRAYPTPFGRTSPPHGSVTALSAATTAAVRH